MAAPAHCTSVTLQSVGSVSLPEKQQMPWSYQKRKCTDCSEMSGPVERCEMWRSKADTVAEVVQQHDKLQGQQMGTCIT